jgi:hypothetical protein
MVIGTREVAHVVELRLGSGDDNRFLDKCGTVAVMTSCACGNANSARGPPSLLWHVTESTSRVSKTKG